MTRELEQVFNREVERFRMSLLLNAAKSEWDAFRENAETLFDYLETIEIQEVERKFFAIFKVLLALLFIAVAAITKIDINSYPEYERLRYVLTVLSVSGCCYELYFFLSFRKYLMFKSLWRKARRQRFVRDIENDFRDNGISAA